MVDEAETSDKSWVELRVHGVSGAPPEDLLAAPHVLQVAGDDRSRFFRAVNSAGHVRTAKDGHAVEGFHWGRFTSGSWIKAFWLALLPFGLVNASAFMLPAPHDTKSNAIPLAGAFRLSALAVLRYLALLLTVLLSFATSLTLIYVVGSRWAPRQSFVPHWLEPAIPSIMVALSGVFVLLLGGVVLIGRIFGRPTSDPEQATSGGGSGIPFTPFAGPDFYRGDPDTLTLRGLHVAAGLAVPAYLGLTFAGKDAAVTGVAGWLLGGAVVVTVLLGDPEQAATTGVEDDPAFQIENENPEGQRTLWQRLLGKLPANPWHWVAARLSALFVVAGLVLVGWASWSVHNSKPAEAQDNLDHLINPHAVFDDQSVSLLYAGALGLVALAATVGGLAIITRHERAAHGPGKFFRPYSKGMTTFPMAAMALFLGVGYSAAVVIGVSSLLGTWDGTGKKVKLGIIPMLDRVAFAWGLSLIPLLVIAVILAVRRRRGRPGRHAHALIGYPDGSPFPLDRLKAWRSKLGSAVWFARVKNGAEQILWTLVVAGGILSLAIVVKLTPDDKRPAVLGFLDLFDFLGFLSQQPSDSHAAAVVTQLGAWVLIGLISGLVFLARGALRDASVQRSVNIIWDVIAFWPHAVHPFIPTPYSLRVVRDLADRVRHHAGSDETAGREVVVCGHSQGSLVSFAAVNLFSQNECDRVGLLTFGSQLRLIFARAFPMYVNYDAISRMHERLGGAWVNLYRDTDPLAGPVLSWHHEGEDATAASGHFPDPDAGERRDETVGRYRTRRSGDDWRLVDPVPRVEELQPAPVNKLHGHSNYWLSPEWATALDAVRSR